jgi:broad specificity phosphatase PhoE
MTRIWLVRHGETQLNAGGETYTGWNDHPLTELGVRQAELTAKRLAREPVTQVFSSGLARAEETARIIAEPHGLQVGTRPSLNEAHYGNWVGRTRTEIMAEDPEFFASWDKDAEHVRIPGGETFAETTERAYNQISQIAYDLPNQTAVVVAHKAVNRLILCRILGYPLSEYRQIGQSNCALNLLLWENGYWLVESINDTFHLKSLKKKTSHHK